MEIHQSSLNILPAKIDPRRPGEIAADKKQPVKIAPVNNQPPRQQPLSDPTGTAQNAQKILTVLYNVEKTQPGASISTVQQLQRPIHSRAIKALEAYTTIENHPGQADLTGFLSRVDVFV